MVRVFLVAVLCVLPTLGTARADSAAPLLHLLEQIPSSATGPVSLSDIAAVKRQVGPLAAKTPSPTRELVPYSVLYNGVNKLFGAFAQFAGQGGRAALGFSIFEISRTAAWGERNVSALIIDGVSGQAGDVEAALLRRDFKATEYKGHRVWHRGRDYRIYAGHREDDPFGAVTVLRSSQRFCFRDGFLLFSRGWPTMHGILDAEASLADEPAAGAIVRAGYRLDGIGDLIDVVLLSGQPETTSTAVPTLPEFNRYGLLLWLNGAAMTGGLAIPYPDAVTAETARDRFLERLATIKAPTVGRPFTDFLPWPRHIRLVEISGLSVLIFEFQSQADVSQPANLLTFARNPRRTLLEMVRNHDMSALTGHSP